MKTVQTFSKVFEEKLHRTGDIGEAFKKAIWIAFMEGVWEGMNANVSDSMRAETKSVLREGYKGVFEMGFNLETFFNDLEGVLNNPHMSEKDKNEEVKKLVAAAKKYAQECHQI